MRGTHACQQGIQLLLALIFTDEADGRGEGELVGGSERWRLCEEKTNYKEAVRAAADRQELSS